MLAFVLMLSAQAYEPFDPQPFFREEFQPWEVYLDRDDIQARIESAGRFQELQYGVLAPNLGPCLNAGTPVDGGFVYPLDGEDGHWLVVELHPPQTPFAVHGIAAVFEHGMTWNQPCESCPEQWITLDATLAHDYAVRAGPSGSYAGDPTAGAQVWSAGALSNPNQGFNLTSETIDTDGDGEVDPLILQDGESLYVGVEMREMGVRTGMPMCGNTNPPGWWVNPEGRGWSWTPMGAFGWSDTAPLIWAWGYEISE